MSFLMNVNKFEFNERYAYSLLEIKLYGLGSRIEDVEAFWYKSEIKIIVFDYIVYPDPKFFISKTKNSLIFFWG